MLQYLFVFLFYLSYPVRFKFLAKANVPKSFVCCCTLEYVDIIQVAKATVFHLFPSRTEKLSPSTPMVLPIRWESR